MAAAIPSCVHFGSESEPRKAELSELACRSPVAYQPYTFITLGRRDGSHCNGYTVIDGVTIAVADGYVSLQSYRQAGAAMKVRIPSPMATLSLTAARLMLADADVGKLT